MVVCNGAPFKVEKNSPRAEIELGPLRRPGSTGFNIFPSVLTLNYYSLRW